MVVITKETVFTSKMVAGCQIHRRYLYGVILGQIGEILEEGIKEFEIPPKITNLEENMFKLTHSAKLKSYYT